MKVISVGNALVDLLVMLPSHEVLRQLGLVKGSMQLIEKSMRRNILEIVKDFPQKIVSGGSAANTAVGMAQLNINSSFVGVVGNDNFGDFFQLDLKKQGVHTFIDLCKEPTGVSIVLVTPDGERTFATFLGASLHLTIDAIHQAIRQERFDWLYVEGFLVENHDFFESILKLAKEINLKVGLDLANFAVVERHRDFLYEMIRKYVDLVFVNREECIAFCHQKSEESIDFWKSMGKIVALKLAEDGAIIIYKDAIVYSPTEAVEPLDTTGAGDLFAAGFMFGLSQGLSMEKTAKIANFVAREIIQIIGAKLPVEKWSEIRGKIKKIIIE
ncbi:MAG: adenosine kinase [Bacteroidales bacterium]|nr:adenosine kinase [Bacteroidales bacterium]